MAVDHEPVRERERDPAPGLVTDLRGEPERILRGGRVPEVALEVRVRRAPDQVRVDVVDSQLRGGPEVGVHRSLGVGRHQDQRIDRSPTRPSVPSASNRTPAARRSWVYTSPS